MGELFALHQPIRKEIKMIYDYLFEDMETGEEFFVETDSKEEALRVANTYFEEPRLLMICTPEDADILGYDTY
jgi:hypothetical protein